MKAAHVRFHSPFEQRVYSFFEKFRELGELRGGADHFLSLDNRSISPSIMRIIAFSPSARRKTPRSSRSWNPSASSRRSSPRRAEPNPTKRTSA
jgi:hypothetical protein